MSGKSCGCLVTSTLVALSLLWLLLAGAYIYSLTAVPQREDIVAATRGMMTPASPEEVEDAYQDIQGSAGELSSTYPPYLIGIGLAIAVLALIRRSSKSEDNSSVSRIASGQIGAIRQLLIADPTAVTVPDGDGRTLLHYAGEYGQTEIAALLIENGSDVNARCRDGQTPLHLAAAGGHAELVHLLLDSGADIEAEADGCTALGMAPYSSSIDTVRALLDSGASMAGIEECGLRALLVLAADDPEIEALVEERMSQL